MKIQLIAVGTKMPDWVTTGFNEYQRRFPKDMPLELLEIPAGKRGKNADIARILEKEGEQALEGFVGDVDVGVVDFKFMHVKQPTV